MQEALGRESQVVGNQVPVSLTGLVSSESLSHSLARSVTIRLNWSSMEDPRKRMEVTQVTPDTTSFPISLYWE